MIQRFKYWVMLLVASIIVCLSFLSYQHDLSELGSNWSIQDRWIFMLSTTSTVLSFFGTIAAIFPEERPVCRTESILIWFVVILWSIGSITTIINPFGTSLLITNDDTQQNLDNNNPTDDEYVVIQPTVYFFSLFSLIISIVMVGSWFKQYIVDEDSPSATYWILLGSRSFFALVSAFAFRNRVVERPLYDDNNDVQGGDTSIYQESNSTLNGNQTNTTVENIFVRQCETIGNDCTMVTFAIVLSAISAGCCCVVVPWKGVSMRCQNDVCLLLFVSWCIGVGLLTKGTGPATTIGI